MDEFRQEDIERLRQTMPIPKEGRGQFLGRHTWLAVTTLALLAIFVLPIDVFAADFGNYVSFGFSMLLYYITSFVGQLLLIFVGALIYIAQYNGFVTSAPVANGWTIVRDIANMFFIVALLLIAFGTILGIGGSYDYKTALPRFVMMAILVNFSRTICGLIIDFAQVVMLTFVNGFKEAAGGNFINAFQISNLMQMDTQGGDINRFDWAIMMSFALALVFVLVASWVIVIMIAVLVVRIVYLWLLIVMSPLAFLSSTIPVSKAKGFYADWWDKFNNQVLVGPFLAFFLWLALISVASGGIAEDGFPEEGPGSSETEDVASQGGFQNIGIDGIQQFIIAIGLLLGGVAMAQQMSGAAVAAGKGVAKGAGKVAWKGTKLGARLGYEGLKKAPVGWTRDKDTKKFSMVNLQAAVGARRTQIEQSRLGRRWSKEGREVKQQQREVNVLRAMGLDNAANAKELAMAKTRGKTLSGMYDDDGLVKLTKDKRASETDRRGAMWALAEKGHRSLWGGGSRVHDQIVDVGGSKNFEQEVRKQMFKNGDKNAFVTKADDLATTFGADFREQSKQLTNIVSGVQLDEDGKQRDEFAIDKLKLLDRNNVSKMTATLQKNIQDALLLAAQIDPSVKDQMADKWNELFMEEQTVGGVTTMSNVWEEDSERGRELYDAMQADLAGKRAAGEKEAKKEPEPVDREVAKQMSGGDSAAKTLTNSASDTIKNVSAALKGKDVDISPESARKMAEELARAMEEMEDAAGLSEVSVRDELGKKHSGSDAFGRTTMAKDLKSAIDALNTNNIGNAKKFLDSASVSAVGIANAGKMSPERRKDYYRTLGAGDRKLTQALSSSEQLTKAATDKERRREAKRMAAGAKSAASYMVGPVMGDTGGKKGVLAPDMQADFKRLREMANKVKKIKEFNQANMAQVEAMTDLMSELQSKLR